MKKYRLLLPLVGILLAGIAACTGNSGKSGCTIEGNLSFEEYKKVYLMDNLGNRIDSCNLDGNGSFRFELNAGTGEPYVAVIHTAAEQDSTDQLDMPVAIEDGTVKVEIGEYIRLSGTPLNARIKEFLDALQYCKDGLGTRQGITVEEIGNIFSEFYRQQILSNKDNVVGRYIYQNYGTHLNAEDRVLVKAQMGN